MERRIELVSVGFAEEGVSITYMTLPDDVRMQGALFAQHTLNIAANHPNYDDDIDRLRTTVIGLLTDALDDFGESQPVEPDDVDEDDERGMGE